MEERKHYESPQVELIEVNVEQGFATSQTPAGNEQWGDGGSWN